MVLYKRSDVFRQMLRLSRYFRGENPSLDDKYMLRFNSTTEEKTETDAAGNEIKRKVIRPVRQQIAGNRIASGMIARLVIQRNQFLLGGGVTMANPEDKQRLGYGFDRALQQLGELALVQGVSYGFWTGARLEVLAAAKDPGSGCFGLMDERTGDVMAAVQFWQLNRSKPMYVRLFEPDGYTLLRQGERRLEEEAPKRPYRLRVLRDGLGETIVGGDNPPALPVVPFYANQERRSEITPAVLSKVDAYDRILSDYGDNLDRANDVYWVLNNFGGDDEQALACIRKIQEYKLALTRSDGLGGQASAEPRTIEVPYEARSKALTLLERNIYQDFMALSMDELTGGSLTNVAIQAATMNLGMACDRYEWEVHAFVQRVAALAGVQTEEIAFKRQNVLNRSEIVADILSMASYIDRETALRLNPYIEQDDVPAILERLDAEDVSGLSGTDALQRVMESGTP